MSGLFDNRSDSSNRREERDIREQTAKKKTKRRAIVVFLVFATLVSVATFINSKFVRRSPAAVTVGGVGFSAIEYDYHFGNIYNNYANNVIAELSDQLGDSAEDYAYMLNLLPVQGQRLSEQIQDIETGETWADFFHNATISDMSRKVQVYNAAMADDFTLPDDTVAAIEDMLDWYDSFAKQYYGTFESFFYQNYGLFNMNLASYRKILTFEEIVNAYQIKVSEAFIFDDEQKAEYYSENRDLFDSYTYRQFSIITETPYFEEIESYDDYEAAYELAIAETMSTAAFVASNISNEEEFIAAAAEYNEVLYLDVDATLQSTIPGAWLPSTPTSIYEDQHWLTDEGKLWLMDSGRSKGDCASFMTGDSAYLLFYLEREPNSYRLPEMRQILISPEEIDYNEYFDGENYTDGYLEALEAAENEAEERAEELLSLFVELGATEEVLIDLMPEYSDDTTQGGLYTDILRGQMVLEIESWLYDTQRQVGDYMLINTVYGYHLVYLSGFGERYSDYLATEGISNAAGTSNAVEGLRSLELTAWLDSLESVEAIQRWAFYFTQRV